jgi:heme-degrading monooxygenase HmoA
VLARMWHGRVPLAKAADYERYLERTGLPDYRATPGNCGAWLLRRDEGDITHFTTLTFWASISAIKAFAGEQYELARYYPSDDEFLLEREPHVIHHEIVDTSVASRDTSA